MSIRKASLQEFQHQIKDIRSQLLDQIKCLEQRTDVQVSILHEVNDFLKKRAELDLEYSKQLDKLVKSVMLKYKSERQKRMNWTLYSTCNLWQQLVDDTKEEAKQRGITAEVYVNHIACREIGVLAQGEIIRVLNELQTAMKTYQLCYSEFNVVNAKLQQAEVERNKLQESNSSRKQKSFQKNFNKKCEKFEASRLKCNRARNEYLLCIDAANAALHKFFADDLSDLIDCTDLGMEYWLNLILTNVIAARKAACQTEMNSLANLGSFKDSLQPQLDKQKFFESNSSTFMLPKRFDFKCDSSETINFISLGEGLSEELKQRHHQIRKRLTTLRSESDESWRTLEETDQRIKSILSAATLVEITEHGIADHRPPAEGLESELAKAYEFYLQNFSFYLFNANLIMRLEARADGIGNALLNSNVPFNETFSEDGGGVGGSASQNRDLSGELIGCDHDWHEQSRRKKRLGSQASAATGDSSGAGNNGAGVNNSQSSPRRRRPRLFGGSLEEYVEFTSERIPLIVTSCIRVLSQFALHHQGVFRVSGSQVEINHMKEVFENGDDPLRNVQDASDVNSIAGVLKLYFRELREPLFPFYLFELLTDCAKCNSTADFISQIMPLLSKLPRATYLILRYLFAFLNHLSEFSDENMMDPYNLAICFGPTLLPIPEGKDQVYYQNYVNEVVKNLIVHHDLIFTAKVVGPKYQKYDVINAMVATNSSENNNEIEMFVDDTDEYFGSTSGAGVGSGGDVASAQNGTLSSTDFFDYRNYSEELLHNPYRVHNYHMNSYSNNQSQYVPPSSLVMNASAYSMASNATTSLGLSHYSDCLPPSITATLVKPDVNTNDANLFGAGIPNNYSSMANSSLNSKDLLSASMFLENGNNENDFDKDEKTPRLFNTVVKPACVVEEDDLDSFSSRLQIQASPQFNQRENRIQQRVQLRHLQSTPGVQSQPQLHQVKQAEPLLKSYTNLVSPVRKNLRGNGDATSPLAEISMESSHQSLRDTLSRNNSTSRCSIRSNSSGGGVCGPSTGSVSSTRSQARDSSRQLDSNVTNLPPSPLLCLKDDNQFLSKTNSVASSDVALSSQLERIRIPVAPDFVATYASQNSQKKAYNQRTNSAILPSYDVLYGSKSNGSTDESKINLPNSASVVQSSANTIVNSTSQSDSMGGGTGGGSSRSSSSLSGTTPRSLPIQQQLKNQQNSLTSIPGKNNGDSLYQKPVTNAGVGESNIKNLLQDNSPTRKMIPFELKKDQGNGARTQSTAISIQRIQRQKSDLTAARSLPPSGSQQQLATKPMSSPTKRPIALMATDSLTVTQK